MAGAAKTDCPKNVSANTNMPNLHRSRFSIHAIVITLHFPFQFCFFLFIII